MTNSRSLPPAGNGRKHRAGGFTLIEVMTVMAIVTILAAIAIPAYGHYVKRGKLAEAFAALGDFRLHMEAFNQDNRSYANNGVCGAALPRGTSFTFQCTLAAAGTQYTVTATSQAGTGLGNAGDYEFDINQDGVKNTLRFAGAPGPANQWQNI